jgi:hypothetical protein
MFDLLAAADAAGSKTLGAIFHPARSARLIELERRGGDAPTYAETLAAVEDRLFWASAAGRQAEIARRLQTRFVSMLIEIASGGGAAGEAQASSNFLNFGPGATASPEVRIRANAYLKSLGAKLGASPVDGFGADRVHRDALSDMISAHLSRPAPAIAPVAKVTKTPPGSPIGSAEECWFCDLN